MEERLKEFTQMISRADKTAIIGHFNPDGDSVGSISGMKAYLDSIGKESVAILPSTYPTYLGFLDTTGILIYNEDTEKVTKTIQDSDLIICIDFNRLERTEQMKELLFSRKCPKILIDHHPNPETESFQLVFSDTAMSSACELLFWILYQIPPISGEIGNMDFKCAQALCTGMLTDTNNFNNSVISSTFEMASLMMKRGIDFEKIHQLVFSSYSEYRMRLMGHMLSETLVVNHQLHAAYMVLSLKDQNRFNYQTGDSEGFVNLPLTIMGVEVTALFTENTDNIRVSLRSKGNISVNALSHAYFNGGGHERAAGGKLKMPLQDVPAYFIESLTDFLKTKA